MNGAVASALLTTTVSGAVIDLDDPQPGQIRLNDLATHQARLCRYAGATIGHYSVAQHAVLVAEECTRLGHAPIVALYAVLHDAHEAYIGDIVLPLESRLSKAARAEIDAFRRRLDRAIFFAAGLPFPMPQRVAAEMWSAHARIVAAECRDQRAGDAARRDLAAYVKEKAIDPSGRRIYARDGESAAEAWHAAATRTAAAAGITGTLWSHA